MARICLIVDNPLRDLDGLVLLGRTLAANGHRAFLVPMYTQALDVAAIQPDLVVANYARHNNLDLLKLYRRRGIKVAILDTEGAGGRNAEEFAALVEKGGAQGNVDLYCAWGHAQFEALLPLLGPVLKLTGCPRYDFCAPKWRPTLRNPSVAPGYVLINTNFPAVNPRFSTGGKSEAKVAVKVGFDAEFASNYIDVATRTLADVIALARQLAMAFPDLTFILRPHPFENPHRYASLGDLSNFALRQEGTSLEWIAGACMLLHLNCSTAVEAAMLGKPPVSPAWLDEPVLRVPAPSALSVHAQTFEDLSVMIALASRGTPLPQERQTAEVRQQIIEANYFAIDGRSSERVADAIAWCLDHEQIAGPSGRPKARTRLIHAAQRACGARAWWALVDLWTRGKSRIRRDAKAFAVGDVGDTLDRLATVDDLPAIIATQARSRASGGGIVVQIARAP